MLNVRAARIPAASKSTYIKHTAVFDIEANDWIRFELLGFFDGQQYKEFRTIGRFLNFLDSRAYRGFRIYAHNGGKYDFMFLLDKIFDLGWRVRIIERSGRIIALHCRTDKTNFVLCDSYALLPASLAALTKAFNVEHKKQSGIDFTKHISKENKRVREYLEYDCIGLYEVLETFFNSEFIDRPQFTIAAQAMNTFKSIFFDGELKRMPLDREELFRDNYYSGGRVEVYKGRGDSIHGYDVNSLFPFAMLQEMPCGEAKNTRVYHAGKIGFYRCWIPNVPEFYISPLLIKRKERSANKLYFVNGAGEYFLSSATIEYLRKELGLRIEILDGYVFPKREAFLVDYVTTFYKMKQENEGNAKYLIAKLMLNSLYGKFGQSRWKESVELYRPELTNFVEYDSYYGLVLVSHQSKSKFILPYIAAYITDLARLHHFKLLNENAAACFYCDTDSIWTNKRMPKETIGKEIGKLSYLGKRDGIFLAPKTYALRDGRNVEIKFKGFSGKGFTWTQFKHALKNSNLSLVEMRERILTFRECLKRKAPVKLQTSNFLKLVESEKKVRSIYDKRQLIESAHYAYDSKPFNWTPESK